MEKDIESCIECYEESGAPGGKSKGLNIIDDFNEMYNEQLKKAQDTSEGTLQIKTLQHWVFDLSQQNKMLVKTVEELEGEALKRLGVSYRDSLEASSKKSSLSEVDIKTLQLSTSVEMNTESLRRELEKTKEQLNIKTNLEAKYLKNIEELRQTVEIEQKKSMSEPKMVVHRSSMTDVYDSEVSAFHYELEATKLKLVESEREMSHLRIKLTEAESNIRTIRSDLCNTEKNARDMRAALTAEVAEKHDQILALKREVTHLEDQLRQADMQTHFKDDIIKKLREDVKVARSKETLAEVLGITEKSQCSKMKLDQLKQQLESKEQQIARLEERLKNIYSPDREELIKKMQERDRKLEAAEAAFCRIRQQMEWFTNNVLQQCHKTTVSKQFETHLQTQLGELNESLKYSDFDTGAEEEPLTPESPISSGTDMFNCKAMLSSKTVMLLPAKSITYSVNSQRSETKKLKSEIREQAVEIARLEDTLDQTTEQLLTLHATSCRNYYHQQDSTSTSQRLVELQKDVEEAHSKMVQSWAKLRDMSQQMSCKGMKSELEQYKICATKEQSTLSRLQTEINTLLAKLATRELHANRITQLIESLRDHLIVVQTQLQQGLNSSGQSLHSWIKTLQESLSAAQAQLLEIERSAKLIKDEREEFARTQRVEETMVKSLQQELYRIQQARLKAFDKLCQAEKSQREDWNRLVNTVIHHHDLCKREQVASDDMKQEINQLVTSLSAKAKQLQSQEEIIKNLQQTLCETKSQNQRFHKRRSVTLDTDGDDEEGYHTLAKTQQEVETLRQMVNMRDRQILEKEQKISALKKALSKTRSDVRGGRFPSRVSVAPSVCKVGEVEEYRQQTLQIQAIVSRIQMEVVSTFNEMEYRDQQLNRLIEGLQKTLDFAQQELDGGDPSTLDPEDKVVKLKSAMNKCQKSIKHFIRKTQEFISQKDTSESNRTQLQSRMNTLQAELEAAQDDLLDQLQSVTQEETFKTLTNSSPAEVKLETLQFELEQNKKMMFEMESRNRSAEEQNQKLKQDLAKAQEELSRVRSLPAWKKTVATTSEHFKITTQQSSYADMEQNLLLKENAMARVQEDLLELTCNLQSRDKLIETQKETIQVLQSSLKLEHEESEDLRKKISRLESVKDTVKTEYKQKIEELESTVSSLQDTRKKSDEASLRMKEGISVLCKIMFSELKDQYHQCYQEAMKETQNTSALRDANIELATLCGHLQQEYHRSQEKLVDSYSQRTETEKKHQKALAALQIVICNLNEKIKGRDGIIHSTRQEIKQLLDKANNQTELIAKNEKKIQGFQIEIVQRDKEISTLNARLNEFLTNASKRDIKEIVEASKKDQMLLLKKVTELSDELTVERDKNTKLSLQLNLAANELQRERKLNEIHKQRINDVTETLSRKSEEVSELDSSYHEIRCKFEDSVKEIKSVKEQMKHVKKQYQMEALNSRNDSMVELQDQIKDLTKQLNTQIERSTDREKELRAVQEKLLQAAKKEVSIHHEYSQKEGEWMERIRDSQAEVYKLTDVISSLTDELSVVKTEIDRDKSKHATIQQKLEEAKDTIESLRSQLNEKEAVSGKLHGALTHLSLKVVSNVQNLENKESLLRHCEEQIVQLQSLLQEKINQEVSKDEQIANLKKELENLHSQLDIEQKKHTQISRKESIIQLLESKVEQLTVELESCKYMHNRDSECVAALLSEKADEMAKKDEEIISLQLQLKKSSIQRDKLEAELNLEHEKLLKLQECNSTLTYNLKQLEHSKNQLLIELESMRKLVDELRHELKCHSESADLELKQQSQNIVDNAQHCISEQRQFSLSLATQLRYTKQELKAIKQENRVLLDSVKCLKTTNHGLEKELRALHNEGMDSDFDLVRRSYEMENFRSKSNITLDDQPLMEVKLKAGRNSTHSGLSSSSKAWQMSSMETDKSEYKNWKRRIQNLAQTSTLDDSKDSIYYSSST